MATESSSAKRYGQGFRIIAWIHTHVQGAICGFSSIDVHTQFGYIQFYPDIAGIVVELKRDGGVYADSFTLSESGKRYIGYCSRVRNASSRMHGECSERSFFESMRSRVHYMDEMELEVIDARLSLPFDLQFESEMSGESAMESPPNVESNEQFPPLSGKSSQATLPTDLQPERDMNGESAMDSSLNVESNELFPTLSDTASHATFSQSESRIYSNTFQTHVPFQQIYPSGEFCFISVSTFFFRIIDERITHDRT